jgi:hypothetical protein
MPQIKYCDQCKRIVGIGCTCNMTFKEKIKGANINWISWSDTRKDIDKSKDK